MEKGYSPSLYMKGGKHMTFMRALLRGKRVQSELSGRIFDTSELNPKFMGQDAVITNNITTEKERTKSWKIIE